MTLINAGYSCQICSMRSIILIIIIHHFTGRSTGYGSLYIIDDSCFIFSHLVVGIHSSYSDHRAKHIKNNLKKSSSKPTVGGRHDTHDKQLAETLSHWGQKQCFPEREPPHKKFFACHIPAFTYSPARLLNIALSETRQNFSTPFALRLFPNS